MLSTQMMPFHNRCPRATSAHQSPHADMEETPALPHLNGKGGKEVG